MTKRDTMRIDLSVDKDDHHTSRSCTAHKAGTNILVRRVFGEKCIADGIATEAKPKRKPKAKPKASKDAADAPTATNTTDGNGS